MSGQDPKYSNFMRYYHSSKYFVGGALLASYFWTKTQNTNQKYTFSLSRELSRVYGYVFRLNLPDPIRVFALNSFVSIFGVNLKELEKPLEDYSSLSEFFTRRLQPYSRKIDNSSLVSPCDSRVMSLGYANEKILSVKGSDYSLCELVTGDKSSSYDNLRKVLLKNPDNELYYITLYLAPYDYHRFHSPTDFQVNFRRHIYGYMQGVFPWNLSRKKDVFITNERVVYTGEWKHGSLVYIPVAAFNVGDIQILNDPELKTNLMEFDNKHKLWDDVQLVFKVGKGEEFGLFNAGSTIIMVFEAPRYLKWTVKPGDKVWMGNSLTELK